MIRSAISSRAAFRVGVTAAAGLMLVGCHSSGASGGGSGSGSGGSASSPAAPGSSSPATGSGSGSAALFPYDIGDTWVYNITLGGTDSGTSTNKVTSVTPVPGGNKVTFSISENIAGLPATTTSVVYVIHPDGSITVPFAQVGNGTVTVKSGSIVWPSQAVLDSGTPHRSKLVVQIKSAAISTTVHANVVVQGGGTQSVTVPAGTYQATVVNETIAETVEGISVSTVVRTWLAPGVGPVKSEVLTKSIGASKVSGLDELKSFTKG